MNRYQLVRTDVVGPGECKSAIVAAHSPTMARKIMTSHTIVEDPYVWQEDTTQVRCVGISHWSEPGVVEMTVRGA